MKKLGLEEVSSNKNEKDDRFLLRQLAERVPLSFWSEFYDCPPEKAASKLAKNPSFSETVRPVETDPEFQRPRLGISYLEGECRMKKWRTR